ncbi:MAG: orotidine-5'-phosphate decarboxylase [Deltaproteobacteria bacterium]|nr:orotidine-5'-phosphate decarboxylase [Deltaproteobacteria bacterium]
MPIDPKDKIIVALDVDELERAAELAAALQGHVGAFKIGKQLFTRCGPEAVSRIHDRGGRLFLDLKYHDIPTTVAKASREATRLGVFMFNMHASGGFRMMREAAEAASETAAELRVEKPLVLAVTVLTSMGAEDLQRIGFDLEPEALVVRLARLAQEAGLDGVVASPREIIAVKQACGKGFVVVTPGIRPASSPPDDQKRTMTPAEAMEAGADYIVVGRPITQAPDPAAAAQAVREEMLTEK